MNTILGKKWFEDHIYTECCLQLDGVKRFTLTTDTLNILLCGFKMSLFNVLINYCDWHTLVTNILIFITKNIIIQYCCVLR